MQGIAPIIFVLFALLMAGLYLAIRRNWFAPGTVAFAGVILAMALMTLFSLAQNNPPLQAVLVGVLLGGLFSAATLITAWYFRRSEQRAHYAPGPDQSAGGEMV